MNKSLIKEFLKRPIAYQPIVAKSFGSVKLAILWCQFYYWMDKGNDPDGWIYKTQEAVFDETGLGRREQETARKIGIELGVLESKAMGKPYTVHFRVNLEKTEEIIVKYLGQNKTPKLFDEPKPITPGEFNIKFFHEGQMWLDGHQVSNGGFTEIADFLINKIGITETKKELTKFILYWTETNKSGKRMRFETQNTFDVKRRLATWLNNKVQFEKRSNSNEKKGYDL